MTERDKIFNDGEMSGLLKALRIIKAELDSKISLSNVIANTGDRIHALIKEHADNAKKV